MIDLPILAAIHARLDRALAPPRHSLRPLVVGDAALGFVDDVRAARLERFGARLFSVGETRVEFARGLVDPASRSAAMADVAAALRAEGALPGWRDELYRVATAFDAPPALLIERGAARYFGIRTWAAHVNGIVRRAPRSAWMWLARRSPVKATDPGMLDNLVGGGIAAGRSVASTVVKEAWEEAGIGAALAATARATSIVHVRRALADGLQRETVFAHDLDLPADFEPVNQDGEATEHRLVDVDDAAAAIAVDAGPDEMTVDASLVVLDFLIRHCRIGPREPLRPPLAALLGRGADDPPPAA